MATRRIAQDALDAVLQEKAKRYHVDASGEAVGDTLQFKAQGKEGASASRPVLAFLTC